MKNQQTFYDIINDSLKDQIKNQGKSALALKILAMVSLYTFMIINSLHDLCNPGHVPECIRDEMQEVTLPITQFLDQNRAYRNALIILASFMIDFNVIYITIRWFLFDRNYKLFTTCFMFYLFRMFLQNVFFMRFPTDYVWGHPGLFSIAVPYAPANDFFFSGHVGLCTISFIYFKRAGRKYMAPFALVTIAIEFFTLLVTRAHYFIDLVIGIIVAHYIYLLVDWMEEYFEKRQFRKLESEPIANVVQTEEDKLKKNMNGYEKARKKMSC